MGRSRVDRQTCEGDLVITAVAGHYVMGRVTADGSTQQFLHWYETRAEAVDGARRLTDADGKPRVFMFEDASRYMCHQVDFVVRK
jgi:hypothetical protein